MPMILGRYKVISELGRGGMGVVYQCNDTMLGRTVALKRLLSKDNDMLIERFLAEAKSIAALNHPNIMQIYDIARDDKGLLITTEFVNGTDLEGFISKKGKLPLKVALRLMLPICKAMLYAHNRGVIHRDIKPANILLTKDGIPKIGDFGLARTENMKDLEVTGVIMGTRAYASPEQFSDAKHLDHRTDIYSLSAMFYEMLSGNSPQFFRHTDIPESVVPLILKGMKREPAKRYKDLNEMLAQLTVLAKDSGKGSVGEQKLKSAGSLESRITVKDTEMILVPKGEFLFGSKAVRIELDDFYIDKYPVTNAQFASVKTNHMFPPDQENHPATKLTWLEANLYARKIGKRLPNEKEWEKAARGIDGRKYPWGNEFIVEYCNSFESKLNSTTPVDSYPEGASPYGIMDMAGNVWEWTSTYLDNRKTARVLKGGAFNGEAKFACCFSKFAYPEKGLIPAAGFRCAKGVK